MPPQKKLTTHRQKMLELLAEHKNLTTGQLWRWVMPERRKSQAWEELDALREMKLVTSRVFEAEKGTSSQFYWQLTRQGVEQTGVTYGRHFATRQSRETVLFHSIELEFAHIVEEAGWKLVKPQTYGKHRPYPSATEQYRRLAQALSIGAYVRIQAQARQEMDLEDQTRSYTQGWHIEDVPSGSNDYVAHTGSGDLAVVFILCPPQAGNKFWQGRAEQYTRLAKVVRVYGVFSTEGLALARKEELNAAGLRVTTLDRVAKALEASLAEALKG